MDGRGRGGCRSKKDGPQLLGLFLVRHSSDREEVRSSRRVGGGRLVVDVVVTGD